LAAGAGTLETSMMPDGMMLMFDPHDEQTASFLQLKLSSLATPYQKSTS